MNNEEKNIRQLIDRFMLGETSLEEEARIGEWFRAHTEVSDDLKDYRQMFAYFDDGMPLDNTPRLKRKLWWSLSIAASIALALALSLPLLKNAPKTVVPELAEAHSVTDSLRNDKETTNGIIDSVHVEKKIPVRKKGYRKHQFSPAPPVKLIAKADSTTLDIESHKELNLAENQPKEWGQEEEEILTSLLLYQIKLKENIDAYFANDLSSDEVETEEQ